MKLFKINSHPKLAYPVAADDFASDIIGLFTGEKHGHMEKWEYAPALFPGDPAGGGHHWEDLVKNPGHYYLAQGDMDVISWAVHQNELIEAVTGIEAIMELGPGSPEAIAKKTLPFLKICKNIQQYIAIDATAEQSANAARTVQASAGLRTGSRNQDFINTAITPLPTKKTALVMWGSSIGNIEGAANSNPFSKLVKKIRAFSRGLKPHDLMIFGVDTEQDERKILNAYSEPALRAEILSPLHRLKRDGYATGSFDPRVWAHESIWFPENGQCAHTIYPLFDQRINIAGRTIDIPAWRRFISNNSYKFTQEQACRAVNHAGLRTVACLQSGPIALLIAQK